MEWIDVNKLMEDMRNDVMNMLNWKKVAVERIANESERLASNHIFGNILTFLALHYSYNCFKTLLDKNLGFEQYYNMKKLYNEMDHNGESIGNDWKSLKLSPHPNFENALVNLEHSSVHIPVNVFEVK